MALPCLATVRIVTNKYHDMGVDAGDTGVILEVWGDGRYDVEVSNEETGETIAWFTAAEGDLELVAAPEGALPRHVGA